MGNEKEFSQFKIQKVVLTKAEVFKVRSELEKNYFNSITDKYDFWRCTWKLIATLYSGTNYVPTFLILIVDLNNFQSFQLVNFLL